MKPIVETKNLSKWYGNVLGLSDVTLQIEPGITGILGPNGAGKSTFLKLITGQIKPNIGTVRIKGQKIMSEADYRPKYHLKIIICGTGAVGKTSTIRRFVESRFEEGYLLTVGMEPSNHMIEIKNGGERFSVNLLIYDVAGQKRFQTLRDVFFRGAAGALYVFDLTRPQTLDELREWHQQVMDRCGPIPILLLGNKSDLEDQIQVDYLDLEETYLKEFNCRKFFDTSALLNKNIYDAFSLLTEEILKDQKIIPR